MDTTDVFKTDRAFRKKLFSIYFFCIAAISLFVWLGFPHIFKYVNDLTLVPFLLACEIIVIVFLLAFCAPAIFLIKHGLRIIAADQVPYPGMKVIYDTKVIRGAKAVLRGKLFIWLGIISIFFALAGIIASHHYFEKFRNIRIDPSIMRSV